MIIGAGEDMARMAAKLAIEGRFTPVFSERVSQATAPGPFDPFDMPVLFEGEPYIGRYRNIGRVPLDLGILDAFSAYAPRRHLKPKPKLLPSGPTSKRAKAKAGRKAAKRNSK